MTDASFWTEGSVFDRECSSCGEKVVVARAGQALLAQDPTLTIICPECAMQEVEPGSKMDVAPGAIEELEEYFRKKSN